MTACTASDGPAPPDGHNFKVASLGRTSRSILGELRGGEVIAVFNRSFYLRSGDRVVCIGSPAIRQGPLNALCAMPDDLTWGDHVAVGAAIERNGTALSVGRGLGFDYGGASVWQAPPAGGFSRAEMRRGLERLAVTVRRRMPGGLGAWLTAGAGAAAPHGGRDPDPLVRAAAVPIGALGQWLATALAGTSDPAPDPAPLIGLGPGLTPSGDDFLCGAMVALSHLGRGDLGARLAARVLPAARTGTSLISAAYLRCAADGEASEVLFDALTCVAAGGDDGLEACLDAVHAVGHTSGWDSLAGAVAVCTAMCAAENGGRGG